MEQEQHLLDLGQVLWTHNSLECLGQWCAIHRPMPGPWKSWPRWWRDDKQIMERICPCGIGHPVAEMQEHAIRIGETWRLVHGCCGCPCGARALTDKTDIIPIVSKDVDVVDVEVPGLDLRIEAGDLLAQLWPRPSSATVVLETHQWIRLRKLLLAVLSDSKEIT
jgi:hypothetical protein